MTIANRPDAAELKRLYVDLNLTQTQIAAKFGTYQNTVKHWLKGAGIVKGGTTRTGGGNPKRVGWLADTEAPAPTLDCMIPPASPPDATELRRLYVDERLSDGQIGAIYNVPASTIKSWRHRLGLKGARTAERKQSLANFVEEAKARRAPPLQAGRAIDRLTESDRLLVRAKVKEFFIYAEWRKGKV